MNLLVRGIIEKVAGNGLRPFVRDDESNECSILLKYLSFLKNDQLK